MLDGCCTEDFEGPTSRPPAMGSGRKRYVRRVERATDARGSRAMVEVNLLDPESFARGQPHDQFDWLRTHDPVHRHSETDGPGFWAVSRYRDVRAVGRDPVTFS